MLNQKPPDRLNDDQVQRLVIAIEYMQKTNISARLVSLALEKETSIEGKRKILIKSFAQAFELLTVMHMAIESVVTPGDFKAKVYAQEALKDG